MKIYSQGDQAIIIDIEQEVAEGVTKNLIAVRTHLLNKDLPFITGIVPTESSIIICYNAQDIIKYYNISSPLQYMKALVDSIRIKLGRIENKQTACHFHNIPAIYGDQFGPDLEALLRYYRPSKEGFIQLHSESHYFISMMGYSPDFPYLTGMNGKLYVNHTSQKKERVSAGSVIIEGRKCDIVTTDTYSDWLVISYTPAKLSSPERNHFNLLKLGDSVLFHPRNPNDTKLGDFK